MRPSFDVVILVENKEKELNTLHQMNVQINDHLVIFCAYSNKLHGSKLGLNYAI